MMFQETSPKIPAPWKRVGQHIKSDVYKFQSNWKRSSTLKGFPSLCWLVICPMPGNNATLKIDFYRPEKMKLRAQPCWYNGSEMIHLCIMNESSTRPQLAKSMFMIERTHLFCLNAQRKQQNES